MSTIKWKRPSDAPLETNNSPATIAYLESLGYTQIGKKPVVEGNTDKQDKDKLEVYAREKFGVELDKRKGLKKLQSEVEALENEHRN